MTKSRSHEADNSRMLLKEMEILKELQSRYRDNLLNQIFSFQNKSVFIRFQYLVFLFFLSGFLVTLFYYPLIIWAAYVQDIFLYLFNPTFTASYPGNPFINFIEFLTQVFTDPRILQYLPIFLVPFFIALQTAGNYLADIFELEDVGVARHFVSAAALTGSNETIRITHGEVSEEHRTSPTYLIGGPGKVLVDIDSAALFEEPDGTTRVIGPTIKERKKVATLGGFERFRQAIDLRDHFIELREEDGKTSVVKSRSLDGIPITATDVRFMFSVHRDGQKPTLDNPYPFSKKAVEQLVYRATSRVTPDLNNPSTFEFSWVNNMVGLIRGRLSRFMNEHKLAEYLASIGAHEVESAKKQEDEIVEKVSEAIEGKSSPDFTPRPQIKNLFSQFSEEFTRNQYDRGVELHWLSIGTWLTPVETIPKTYIKAWKLGRKNVYQESAGEYHALETIAIFNKLIALIQDVPLSTYQKAISDKREHAEITRVLLLAYRQLFVDAAELINEKGEPVPSAIISAMNSIAIVMGWHWTTDIPEYEADLPKPKVIIERAVALARIKDLPANKQLMVGQSYLIQVDVIRDIKNRSLPIEILGEQIPIIGVVVQADEMIIKPDWFQEITISQDGKSKSPEFVVTPQKPGYKTITVQYYYKFHWLTQVTHHVEVIQN